MDSIESVVARIDERTKGMDANLSAILDRLKWVESVASDVKEFPEFRKMVTEKIEKYDEACIQAKSCPERMEKIEGSVAEIGGRVEKLEKKEIQEDAQVDTISRMWRLINQPAGMGLIVALVMIYLHITGGKV